MKQLVKVAAIIAALLVVLMMLPWAFEGKLIDIAKREGNKMIRGQFNFESLDLSLIRNFPQATVMLNDFYLVGEGEFASDTLLSVKQLDVAVDILSLLSGDEIEIEKILLHRPDIRAKVLSEGEANWDIMKASSEVTSSSEDSEPTSLQLALKKLSIRDAHISFENAQNGMKANIDHFDLQLKGDFSADKTDIKTDFVMQQVDYSMGNIPYLNRAKLAGELVVEADLENNRFALKENKLSINAITTSIDGWLQMGEEETQLDLSLNTSKIQFKEILSLIPAIYACDFEDIKADGVVSLLATAKGRLKEEEVPAFDIALKVENGMFHYQSLPQSVKDIQVVLSAKNPGGKTLDATLVDISRFHFNMGENPFDASLHLATPISDPDLHFLANGKIDLSMIKEVYPVDSLDLQGRLEADLEVAGRYSWLQKKAYEQIVANGQLRLQGLQLTLSDLPQVDIEEMLMKLSPQYVNLSETKIRMGKNDLTLSGNLENMLGYMMKGDVIKGNLTLYSNYFNLDAFLSSSSSSETEKAAEEETKNDTQPSSTVIIPKNIDFDMNATFEEIVLQQLYLKQSKGNLRVKDGTLSINGLRTNALGGSMIVNGKYVTADPQQTPDLHFDLDMQNISFVETFKSFGLVQKMAPIFENITGTFSTKFNIDAPLGAGFMPVLDQVKANGLLSAENVTVTGVKAMEVLATTLKNDKLKQIVAKDLKLPFSIDQGRVYTKPFDLKMGDIKMNLSGSTGLDQSIDYIAVVNMPGKSNSSGLLSSVNLKIGGTFADPSIKIDTEDLAKKTLDGVTDKLKGALGIKEEVGIDSASLSKEWEKLVKEAEEAGQKLIKEAEKAGDKLIEAANTPLEKAGAKVAAEKLKKEAEKKAKQLLENLKKENPSNAE